jgi:hypothetical protein
MRWPTSSCKRSPHYNPNRLALTAALVICLGAAGCGSGANNGHPGGSEQNSTVPTTTGDQLTKMLSKKAGFLAKANEICKSASRRQNAAARRDFASNYPTPAQIISFTRNTALPSIRNQIKALVSLGAPSVPVTRMVNVAQQDLEKVSSNPALLASTRDPFANFKKLAHSYGLIDCAPSEPR